MSGIENSGGQAGGGRVKNAILIAGPTASGKSALVLDIAEHNGGVIVNTDSMQVYSVLDVLTARPTAAELVRVPHFLYGHVHPSTAYSTGAWLRDVMKLIDNGAFLERPVIFVGGTGLYFRALAEGISEMPDIPQSIRDRWRYELQEQGAAKLHRILLREDSATGMMLKPTDGQRIVRALEVLDASGRSILEWQAARGRPLIDRASTRFFVIEPDRAELVERIEARFDRMLEKGALDEVRRLTDLGLDPDLPAMKAIGVRELQAAMAGELSFPEAIERAKIATRQYAKRQTTWFRHQLGPEWMRLRPGDRVESTISDPLSSAT
ncbi:MULTISPECIES: tRNA (adenosine(37)-N6)-dimethylallyltransferase MiaA [unclassified Mesorhizobium]|uniref:tRNA (adenosine(37)-N6)-dimethylallyltransferase MiaA n=1 Tax=unclassified Mesorhizobium TaxID=325217 RepID=UPI000FE677F3|nr:MULTISPECIES: tRNA (adenosine(37)-N6)-dimethylallyltransferase MiaA [unclassified Mesorhizobium]RWB31095.1 MAG: tRNA (adenosine(37)-N6)-dimethylallyltransferase MiaA [Mesorhizobium sp.]RWB34616.1 MAG: tRNA (adenosine(37)-N6)-dimethylallyltransferase MiaA [Mesorhizobium sp.]RWC23459.1 MAG: tRNA (adenosine(37)-N6)-dimethylallyltransferase MiaA [Mesorhizobium sp.]RWD20637.1 MAG: tRNA (adenosine(37)-N6)-dimethylallyltransferase MiaA [Mesorhizobium sp.]RWD35465.1 MAG: tRNA (adenosine(37)-N6)-dim